MVISCTVGRLPGFALLQRALLPPPLILPPASACAPVPTGGPVLGPSGVEQVASWGSSSATQPLRVAAFPAFPARLAHRLTWRLRRLADFAIRLSSSLI